MLSLCFCMIRYEHFDCNTMLDKMLTLCGTVSFVLSDNGTFFLQLSLKCIYLNEAFCLINVASIIFPKTDKLRKISKQFGKLFNWSCPENRWLAPRTMENCTCQGATLNQILTMYSD